jgi:hypothetical protein
MSSSTLRRLAVCCALVCLAPGCGRKPSRTEMPEVEKHILKVPPLYNSYRSAHGGRPPATIDELKAWAKKLPKERLQKLGIEDVEQALTSPRDNQPYVLVDPAVVKKAPMGMARVVVHEKEGVDGKRMTASLMGGGAQEMTEEEMQQAMNPPGRPPAGKP